MPFRANAWVKSLWFSLVVVETVWVACSNLFARFQELWVDETTQLSGLSLSPWEVARWLAGAGAGRFDVPDDRMPPLSYWAGWGWSQVFGLSEASMRAFAIVLIALAAAFIVKAARDIGGATVGCVAGLTFVLSPQVIITGVEIRAYPLLALWSAMACAFLLSFQAAPAGKLRTLRFSCLVATCVAALYTHFFGLMLSAGMFVAVVYLESFRRRKHRLTLIFAACLVLASTGLIPFVRAAFGMSSPSAPEGHRLGRELVRLLYRLLGGHPAAMVYPAVAVCILVGTLLLLSNALFRRSEEGPSSSSRSLFIACGTGLAAAVLVFAATSSFNSLQISYNTWMLPVLCLAAASALVHKHGIRKHAAVLGAALLLLGQAGATAVLLVNAPTYAHTAADRVARLIDDPTAVTILHDESSNWAIAYFPLTYHFGRGLRQCLASRTPDGQLSMSLLPKREPLEPTIGLHGKAIALVTGMAMDTGDLAACVRHSQCRPIPESPMVAILETAGWHKERTLDLPAFGRVQVTWFARTVSP